MHELRLAARRLLKQPAATVAGIATLACAIAAAAATWSLLSAVLLRPLDVRSPERLVVLGQLVTYRGEAPAVMEGFVYPVYERVRESRVFDEVAAGGSMATLAAAPNEMPAPRTIYFASAGFFRVLGVALPLGRQFTPGEDHPGAALVAVLSDRYWRRAFNADPRVIGRTLTVKGKAVTVVGVAPRSFRGLDLATPPDFYMPLRTVADVGDASTNYFADPGHPSSPTAWVHVMCRLSEGVSPARGEARLQTFFGSARPDREDVATQFTHAMKVRLIGIEMAAVPESARPATRRIGTLLGATVAMLLLIGCTTIGMLLLIRTEARREEFAVCLALGASRWRLAAGIALEGLLLSLAGAALAAPLTRWMFAGASTFKLPGGVGIELLDLRLDARIFAALAACAAVASLMVVLAATVFAFSANAADGLRRSSGSARAASRPTRALLVTGQVAVAMVLVGGAALFARSVSAALSLNPGFDTTRTLTGNVYLRPYGYTPERAASFFEDLIAKLRANPAVRSVSAISSRGGMMPSGELIVDGQPRRFASQVAFLGIDDRYFDTIGVRVTRGRTFTADDREGSTLVAIVSESFGRAIAAGGNPIGHRVALPWWRVGRPADVLEVVGVVPDLVTSVTALHPLDMYTPMAQFTPDAGRTIVLRAAGSVDAARREAASAIRQMDRTVTVRPMLTVDERLAEQMSPQRLGALVMGVLGFVAVLLTALGAYVVAETTSVLRRREMGIRAALGARGRQLGRMVLLQTARLVGAGLVAGLGLAWMGASTIRALLFQVEPLDPATLTGAAALILLLSLAVSLKPALQAARVDLAAVLREE